MLDRNKYQTKPNQQSNTSSVKNPYKGTRRVKDESNIPPDVRERYTDRILDLVLYDAEETRALREFEPFKMSTHCIFARKSILWGSRDYHKSLSVGEDTVCFHSLIALHSPANSQCNSQHGWLACFSPHMLQKSTSVVVPQYFSTVTSGNFHCTLQLYAMHSAWFVGLSITLPGYKKYELFRPPNFPQPLLMIALHSPAIINALSTVGWSVLSFM